MSNSKILSPKHWRLTLNQLAIVLGIIAFLGFLDASYITVEHYRGAPLPCSVLQGCEVVTNSQYSTVSGIPVSLVGSFYYLAVLLFVVAYFDAKRTALIRLVARLTWVGFLATLWFLFAQFALLNAVCLYCIFSALTSILLFIGGRLIFQHLRNPGPASL